MSDLIKEMNDADFQSQVLGGEVPTVVDFWATWCAPCRALTPVLEELAKDYDGKVNFIKMNVDDNPNTPSKYAVRSIPTLLFIKGGAVVNQVVGVRQKAELIKRIDEMM